MAEYTPGPWRVRENARHSQEYCDLTICGDIWRLADINGPQYDHQEANARLIAAAPELLEALQFLADVARSTRGFSPMALKQADRAIAKATDGEG